MSWQLVPEASFVRSGLDLHHYRTAKYGKCCDFVLLFIFAVICVQVQVHSTTRLADVREGCGLHGAVGESSFVARSPRTPRPRARGR